MRRHETIPLLRPADACWSAWSGHQQMKSLSVVIVAAYVALADRELPLEYLFHFRYRELCAETAMS